MSNMIASMESSSFLPQISQHSFFPQKTSKWRNTTSHSTRIKCQKMYVPGFGEASPEAKAAKHLHDFFTYVAVRIVTAQLEIRCHSFTAHLANRIKWRNVSILTHKNFSREQSYNFEAHEELQEFLEKHPLNDGDKFCADLMRESSRHKALALRILEVRSAYCKNDFEWDNLKRLASQMVEERNTRLMRDYVSETILPTENES